MPRFLLTNSYFYRVVKLYKSNKIKKLLLLITAIQILNLSIDGPGADMPHSRNSNFNYIDSYFEFVAEVILKYENAVPEMNRHHKELQTHKQFRLLCDYHAQPPLLFYTVRTEKHSDLLNRYLFIYTKDINPPPKYC